MSQCCICKRIRRKKEFRYSDRAHLDDWGHHHEDLAHLHKNYDLVFSHGYCPSCYEKAIAELDDKKLVQF